MAMGGTSAGAGLTMGSVHRFKELKLALPEALLLGTPGADVSKVGDSRYINEGIDRALVAWEGVIAEALIMYADEFDHKHPYVSPVYGDFENSCMRMNSIISIPMFRRFTGTLRTFRRVISSPERGISC
jgi:acetyl esterase/lipase